MEITASIIAVFVYFHLDEPNEGDVATVIQIPIDQNSEESRPKHPQLTPVEDNGDLPTDGNNE